MCEGTMDAATADTAELDALEDLGDEIATLAAHLHAATHRLLTLIAEFDRRGGWRNDEFRSCAHWLTFRTGIDLGAAREKVRAARALESLPEISASMARGELSFAKVRALTRVATPEQEGDLLLFARSSTAAQLEHLVRGWKRLNRLDEAELEKVRHRSRCLSVFPDDEGMYVVRGRLDPEVGALLMRAIEAANDALFRTERREETKPEQRRADAVGLLAERAMAAGFAGDRGEGGEESDATPVSGSRAERYQVMLHVEAPTLKSDAEPTLAELEDGTRVSAETCRRLSCDASVVRIEHGKDGSVLDVGRKTRTIPPAIRRALDARDRGCRFPACGLRFTAGITSGTGRMGERPSSRICCSCARCITGRYTRAGSASKSVRPGPPTSTTPGGGHCRTGPRRPETYDSPSRLCCSRTDRTASSPTGARARLAGGARRISRRPCTGGCSKASTGRAGEPSTVRLRRYRA